MNPRNWYAWRMGEVRAKPDYGFGHMTDGEDKIALVGAKPEGWTEDVPDERDDIEDDDVDAGDKMTDE